MTLALSSLTAGLALADSAAPQPTLTLQGHTLTAQIVTTPLSQVMTEFGKLSGAQVRWLSQENTEPISVSFRALPLEEALSRLLDKQNFLLFYTAGRQLTQVWISSPAPAAKLLPPLLQPLPPIKGEETPREAEANEVNELPLNDVTQAAFKTALADEDPTSHAEAFAHLETEARRDPYVKEVLWQVVHQAADPRLYGVAAAVLTAVESPPAGSE
jgi:hypothetical protein